MNNIKLTQVRELLLYLESGEQEKANRLLAKISNAQNNDLLTEIKTLTVELHDSLNRSRDDSRLARMTDHELPDAADRLNYVVTLTEQAANTTFDNVEKIQQILAKSPENPESAIIRNLLTEIITAQSFQDITGQVLHGVIHNVQKIEFALLEITRDIPYPEDLTGEVGTKKESETPTGPALPKDNNAFADQDDIDALLAEMNL